MSKRELIETLPYPLKQGIKYVYGMLPYNIRYGRIFRSTYRLLQMSQWWSKNEIEDYQKQKLDKLLNHAYNNVPYYQKVFNERGIKPKDIKNFDDLKKLPYLTKEIIRNNLKDLLAQDYSRTKLQYITTGGSTGTPLGFYQEKNISAAREWAFMLTQWQRVGFKSGDKRIVLRGAVVHPSRKGNLWEYNPLDKTLTLSSFHMFEEQLHQYIRMIRKFKPKFIHAYPSVVFLLARFMKDSNIENFSSVKAILCGSENIYPWQRQLLEEVFQCRVYSWYGHTEQCVLAGECEKSQSYHIFPEYGLIELINKDGEYATKEDAIGEIVATGFNNDAMPFIRYKTGDLGVTTSLKCGCGRAHSLLKRVEGRVQEFIVTKDGRKISLGPAIFGIHDADWMRVKAIQFIQRVKGEVTISVIKNGDFSDSDVTSYIRTLFAARFGDSVDIAVNLTESVVMTDNGKQKFLIQELF